MIELLINCQQTIGIDYFKIIIGGITSVLGILVGLNSFWLKKYISDSKEETEKMEQNFKELGISISGINDKYREDNFKLQIKHENIKKDVDGIEKVVSEAIKNQKERMDKHSSRLETAQNEIIVLKEVVQNINDKYDKLIKEVGKTTSASEMVSFLQIQIKNLQDQIINKSKS